MTHDPVAQTAPHKVVIMARGLGTRMRKSVEESLLRQTKQLLLQPASRQ